MRGFVYQAFLNVKQKVFGPVLSSVGRSLYAAGTKIEGDFASEDRLVPSLRNLSYSGFQPNLQAAEFIAPNATILGNVSVGLNSSVWYSSTLIGTKSIKIGDDSVIQDRCHISSDAKIGNNVFVGPNSILQGAELADYSFVSMGSTVRHAKVQSGGFVAAGAVIGDGVVVKEGQIWAGNPGKFLRNITSVEREILKQHLQQMKDLAIVHSEQAQKNSREVISERKQPFQAVVFQKSLEDMFTESQVPHELEIHENDQQYVQRRTIMRESINLPHLEKDYEPFDYNIMHMGQKFNLGVHHEEYKKVATKIAKKERFDSDRDSWTKPF